MEADPSQRMGPVPCISRQVVSTVILAAFFAVLVGVFLVATLSPMKDDIAWLLYVARKWLAGRTLYQDVVEVNPPLIIWLSAIPSELARCLGMPPKLVAIPMFIGQSLILAWWTASILRRLGGIFTERLLVAAVIATMLLLLPGADLGQREHLLVVGFLPYLALSAVFLEGHRTSWIEGLCVGFTAALFCALKPLYGACFLSVEAFMLLQGQRPWRALTITAVLTLLGYVGSIIWLCPAYLKQAVPMALALYGATNVSFKDLLLDSASLMFGQALAVGLLLLRWRSLRHRNLITLLIIFSLTSLAVCLADGKDWYYHRIPAIVSISLALMLWCSDELRHRSWSLRFPLLAAVAVVSAFCVSSIRQLQPELQDVIEPRHSVVERLEDIIRTEHARTYIAFSEWIALGFPVVNNTGVAWASRFDSMWALKGEVWRKGFDKAAAREWPVARWVAHDFLAGCPDIAVVDTREPINYIDILRNADPAFARAWTRYKRIAAFDGLMVYKRTSGGCLDVWVAAGSIQSIVTR